MWTLYKVNCKENIIYIGISSRPFVRILDHFNGNGASITKKFGCISFSFIKEFDSEQKAKLAEKSEVLKLRSVYGKSNVYGYCWTSIIREIKYVN